MSFEDMKGMFASLNGESSSSKTTEVAPYDMWCKCTGYGNEIECSVTGKEVLFFRPGLHRNRNIWH